MIQLKFEFNELEAELFLLELKMQIIMVSPVNKNTKIVTFFVLFYCYFDFYPFFPNLEGHSDSPITSNAPNTVRIKTSTYHFMPIHVNPFSNCC